MKTGSRCRHSQSASSGALAVIDAGGILGLDFFVHFEDIYFHVPSFHLTLNSP